MSSSTVPPFNIQHVLLGCWRDYENICLLKPPPPTYSGLSNGMEFPSILSLFTHHGRKYDEITLLALLQSVPCFCFKQRGPFSTALPRSARWFSSFQQSLATTVPGRDLLETPNAIGMYLGLVLLHFFFYSGRQHKNYRVLSTRIIINIPIRPSADP